MRKVWFLLGFLFLISCVSAEEEVRVYYFYSTGCSHCADVVDSGVLDDVDLRGLICMRVRRIGICLMIFVMSLR